MIFIYPTYNIFRLASRLALHPITLLARRLAALRLRAWNSQAALLRLASQPTRYTRNTPWRIQPRLHE